MCYVRINKIKVSRQGNHINRKNMHRRRVKTPYGVSYDEYPMDMNALTGKAHTKCMAGVFAVLTLTGRTLLPTSARHADLSGYEAADRVKKIF